MLHASMKQIDIIRTYAQKRCLIVDSVPNARAQLKRIMVDFGTTNTDTVGNAEEAIDFCEKSAYDIVLSDYNLGKGKSGQQLLEELRFHKLLRNTSIFIMITAENASHYVLHTLEYAPDDFLQKPVNRESLRPRLDLALLKNEHLIKVKEALDLGKIGRAINAAREIADTPHKFQIDAQKILAELYLKNKQAEDAKYVYERLGTEKLPLWAELGLAHTDYLSKNYESAEKRLARLIRENPYYVEAQDMLARVYEQTHRPVQSQQALINAVKLSPRSAPRQRELGRVSLDVEDENTSVHAYRSAIKHSKNSCHEIPDDQLNLAEGLLKLSKKVSPAAAKDIIEEAKLSLQNAEKKNSSHPIVMMRNRLIEADLAELSGNSEEVHSALEAALDLHHNMRYSVIANSSIQLCIDCAKGFMARGYYDEGEAILQELARINEDDDFALKIDRLLRVPQTKEGIAYAAKLNKEGIGYYEKEQLDEAISSFKKVLKELPNHSGLNLNLVQALVSKNKLKALDQSEISLLKSSFKRLGQVNGSASFIKRYEYLHKRYTRITETLE